MLLTLIFTENKTVVKDYMTIIRNEWEKRRKNNKKN